MSAQELDKSREEGLAMSRNLFSKMNAACEDKAFVAACFDKGMSFEEFQVELLKKVQDENAALRLSKAELQAKLDTQVAAPVAPAGQPPVQLNHAQSDTVPAPVAPETVTFASAAKALAEREKISLSKAYSRIAREQPELYSASNPLHADYLNAIKKA